MSNLKISSKSDYDFRLIVLKKGQTDIVGIRQRRPLSEIMSNNTRYCTSTFKLSYMFQHLVHTFQLSKELPHRMTFKLLGLFNCCDEVIHHASFMYNYRDWRQVSRFCVCKRHNFIKDQACYCFHIANAGATWIKMNYSTNNKITTDAKVINWPYVISYAVLDSSIKLKHRNKKKVCHHIQMLFIRRLAVSNDASNLQ